MTMERMESTMDGDDPLAEPGVAPEAGPIDPIARTGRIGRTG
jgi:hypothetical protein